MATSEEDKLMSEAMQRSIYAVLCAKALESTPAFDLAKQAENQTYDDMHFVYDAFGYPVVKVVVSPDVNAILHVTTDKDLKNPFAGTHEVNDSYSLDMDEAMLSQAIAHADSGVMQIHSAKPNDELIEVVAEAVKGLQQYINTNHSLELLEELVNHTLEDVKPYEAGDETISVISGPLGTSFARVAFPCSVECVAITQANTPDLTLTDNLHFVSDLMLSDSEITSCIEALFKSGPEAITTVATNAELRKELEENSNWNTGALTRRSNACKNEGHL